MSYAGCMLHAAVQRYLAIYFTRRPLRRVHSHPSSSSFVLATRCHVRSFVTISNANVGSILPKPSFATAAADSGSTVEAVAKSISPFKLWRRSSS